jgi:DNA-binding NarL/FixJ family response regulator
MNKEPLPYKILIADDHSLIRSGLVQLLRQWNPAANFAEACDGIQLNALLESSRWDIVLVDLVMPNFAGVTSVCELNARFPDVPMIVVSGIEDPRAMKRLLDAGVAGFLPKATDGELVIKAIELVIAGGRYIPAEILSLAEHAEIRALDTGDRDMLGEKITPRQQEILALLRQGLPNKLIASALQISEATVKMHISALLRAHGVRSRAELLVLLK